MPEIVIDGSKRRARFLILIDGEPVYLTGNSFMYFVRLACARCREGTDGWCHKLELQTGSNQTGYIFRMKNEIVPQIRSGWPVVENNRLGYYRLCASESSIHFNMQNLKDHPIYELRGLLLSVSDFNLVKY